MSQVGSSDLYTLTMTAVYLQAVEYAWFHCSASKLMMRQLRGRKSQQWSGQNFDRVMTTSTSSRRWIDLINLDPRASKSIRWAWMTADSSYMGGAHSTATRKLSGPYCHKLSPRALMWHLGHVIIVDIDWSPAAKKEATTAGWTQYFVTIFYEGWYNTELYHVKNQWMC